MSERVNLVGAENDQAFEFVEISVLADERGAMDTRHLTDICDEMNLQPVTPELRPPYHPHCRCQTVTVLREKI